MSSSTTAAKEAPKSSTALPAKDPIKDPRPDVGEDDEFEDFPADDWEVENTDLPTGNNHLWEESWDDDATNDEFSAQLKEELNKVDAQKK